MKSSAIGIVFCSAFSLLVVLLFYIPFVSSSSMVTVSGTAFLWLLFFLFVVQWALSIRNRERKNTTVFIAFFAVIAGISSVLRFIPLPMGASAFFFIPILVGHVYGPTLGAINAALSMCLSSFLGGGLGPWFPYQVAASGMIGMFSGFTVGKSKYVCALFGVFLGFAYGILMNLWFWPSMKEEGSSGYWAFYFSTSGWWDALRALTNVIFIFVFYDAIVRILKRFQWRLDQSEQ